MCFLIVIVSWFGYDVTTQIYINPHAENTRRCQIHTLVLDEKSHSALYYSFIVEKLALSYHYITYT